MRSEPKPGRVDQGEAWEQAAKRQAQVTLNRRLSPVAVWFFTFCLVAG
ncbi:MAG: hypothetical protein WC378_16390 [Opitutaceae bacterium]